MKPHAAPAGPQQRFAPIPDWCVISGWTRTRTFNAIRAGELPTLKVGRRRLIDVTGGLELLETFRDDRHLAKSPAVSA